MSVRSLLAIAVVATLLLPRSSRGQGLGLSGVVVDAAHDLLSAPLAGAAVAVRWGPRDGVLAFRLGAEGLGGRAERTGIPCAGLIQPGTCAPERVRDDARLYAADAGSMVRVAGGPRAALALTADVQMGTVAVDTRGLASGGALNARRWIWGGRAGVEAWWIPSARMPLALEIGAALGHVRPFTEEIIMDGYTPFNGGFGFRHLRLGLAWRGGTARR